MQAHTYKYYQRGGVLLAKGKVTLSSMQTHMYMCVCRHTCTCVRLLANILPPPCTPPPTTTRTKPAYASKTVCGHTYRGPTSSNHYQQKKQNLHKLQKRILAARALETCALQTALAEPPPL